MDALAATRAAVRGWRDAHARGSTNLDAAPELFRAATAATANERRDETGTGTGTFFSRAENAKQNGRLSDSAVARAVASAPSPRVAAFLCRGNYHASEVAAAPELFCEAAQGVASAAKTCRESLEAARRAFDVFVASLGGVVGDGGVVVDSMPTNALLAVVPLGDDRRTAEQWVWLMTSVLEALARETEVVNEVAGYVGGYGAAGPPSAVPPSAAEGERDEPLDGEKLAGCAEVWRARAFVDETLLRVLVDAEA